MARRKINIENSNKINSKKIGIWFIIAFICLFSAFFVNYRFNEKSTEVKIVATGEKSDKSLGNNIRIAKITVDGEDYSLRNVVLFGGWNMDKENELLTCYDIAESSDAVIYLAKAKNITINYVSEIGSGIAEVYINDKLSDTIDLYSDTDWSYANGNYKLTCWIDNVALAGSICFAIAGVLFFIVGLKVYVDKYKDVGIDKKIKLFFVDTKRNCTVKRVFLGGFTLTVMYIVLFTVLSNVVINNVYKKNAVLSIVATGEKNRDSLATNVRVTDIFIDDKAYDLSTVETKNGWNYDIYDDINYMIYNYNSENYCKIDIPLKHVSTFDIRFAEDVGSGIAKIYLDDKFIDTVDLYKNTSWDFETRYYEISPIIRPYKSYSMILTLFVIGCICVLLFDREKSVCKKVIDAVEFVGTNLVLTAVLYAVFTYMQRESLASVYTWYTESTQYFWDGFCIVFFINILLGILFRKNYVSFMLLAFVFTVFLLINNLKLQFRNMPFLPWDFIMAGVVATVIGQFKITIPFAIGVGAVILIAVAIVSVLLTKRFKFAKPNIISRISIAVCTVTMFAFFMVNYLFTVTVDLFDVKNFYLERGFVGAFFENMQYLMPIEEPENYSKQKMEEIYDEITDSVPEVKANKKPNVILLMSESFWDIRRIKELNFGEEIFPNYTKLQETSTTGELLTNVYGGGTVNSEFEALTGMSVSYLPLEYMPYQRCMRPNFFSINSYLKAAGYKTLAIHPFEKTNYNRNMAYEYFGFDNALWEDDFPEDTDRMRSYISDKALVERIIEEYEKNNNDNNSPWFNLSVSMQNHGAYWDILIDDGKDFDVDTSAFSEATRGSIKDLAIGLHYSDLALGELIDYFEDVDEPTIIIMFGDHMTNAGQSGNSLLDESELLGESCDLNAAGKETTGKTDKGVLEQRRVPFMVWSNYKTVNEDCGIVDIPRLLPTVFSKYDVTMPKYFEFLKKAEDIYPACASGIVVNPDGSYNSISNMTEEQKKLYNELNLIEYDYIFGKHYIKKLFDE